MFNFDRRSRHEVPHDWNSLRTIIDFSPSSYITSHSSSVNLQSLSSPHFLSCSYLSQYFCICLVTRVQDAPFLKLSSLYCILTISSPLLSFSLFFFFLTIHLSQFTPTPSHSFSNFSLHNSIRFDFFFLFCLLSFPFSSLSLSSTPQGSFSLYYPFEYTR